MDQAYQCSVCRKAKPGNEFYWQKDKAKPHAWCKECYRDWHRRRYTPKVPVSSAQTCVVCGVVFTPKQRKPQKFCSTECKNQARIQTERELRKAHTESKMCDRCGQPLRFVPGKASRTRYCGDICQQAAIASRMTPERRAARRFQYHYGISIAQRDELLAAQGGGCAICGRTEPGGKGWAMDHDHACCPGSKTCGKCVRGVLCTRCNLAIGLLQDSPYSLRRAIEYLSRF